MKTEEEKKELRRLRQKRLRSQDTSARKSMLAWNNSEEGKAAIRKYRSTEDYKKSRRKGSETYKKHQIMMKEVASKASNSRQEWTIDGIKKLEKMLVDGMTQKQIALKLGRSLSSIEHKIKRMGFLDG